MHISVVIPTWNRAHTLARALDSVIGQSLPAAEIVVVDDGSTDGTATLVQRAYPGVRLISQANSGVSAARNCGVRHTKAPWIAFLDSDDYWFAHKLERQAAALNGNPTLRLVHSDEQWTRNGQRVNPGRRHAKRGGWIFDQCLGMCALSPSSVVLERRLFEELGGFDEALPACEDYDLWLRISAQYPVGYVDEALLMKTGGHADQLSKRYPAMDRFRLESISNLLASTVLDSAQHTLALEAYRRKLAVYATGARKRGRHDEVAALEAVLNTDALAR